MITPVVADAGSSMTGVAEAGWRWVLDQVRRDDGLWIPDAVPDDGPAEKPDQVTGMHSGIGGLAYVLAEIRLTRDWTEEEADLATAIGVQLRHAIPTATVPNFFDGLVSDIGALVALEEDGVEDAVKRLADLADDEGWPQDFLDEPRFLPGARINDVTLGTGSVLLGALWADRAGVAGAQRPGRAGRRACCSPRPRRSRPG